MRFLTRYRADRPLILDSGCGTGGSSALLGRRFPDAQVLGIDRSAHRLERAPRPLPDNVVLIRARVEDVWRLLHQAGIHPAQHWLLYPNPWPKPAQLARRWHGHPAFPTLLALGGTIVLRTNWAVYAEEFDRAARHRGVATSGVVPFRPDPPLSPFERKYADSGQALFELTIPAPPPDRLGRRMATSHPSRRTKQ